MSFPKYEAYKDSGVEWLRAVPEHWRFKPIWSLFHRTKKTGYPDEQLLSVYRNFGVIIKSSRDDNFNKPSDDLSSYQLVEPGDLTINKMKAWQGSVAISDFRGIVSPAYHIYSPKHDQDSRYLHHLFRCSEYITGYLANSKGIRVNQWDLEPQQHSRMPVLLPPLSEQTQIARFLDHETARIDALIAEQQRLIELLKEKRQAVISHAVTKGLDPTAPMKDSGVEWLGEVPEHWDVVPLKHKSTCNNQTLSDVTPEDYEIEYVEISDVDEVQGIIRTTSYIFSDAPSRARRVVQDGDVLISTVRTYLRAIAPANNPPKNLIASTGFAVIRPQENGLGREYLGYLLRAEWWIAEIISQSVGVSYPAINASDLVGIKVPVPTASEQTQIAHFLDHETTRIDALIAEAHTGISLLQERRSALISAAVTGQIDVRGWQAPVSPVPTLEAAYG